jgi:hypothetical protein
MALLLACFNVVSEASIRVPVLPGTVCPHCRMVSKCGRDHMSVKSIWVLGDSLQVKINFMVETTRLDFLHRVLFTYRLGTTGHSHSSSYCMMGLDRSFIPGNPA